MKKLLFFLIISGLMLILSSCSIIQKNGKSKDKPVQEQEKTMDVDEDEAAEDM